MLNTFFKRTLIGLIFLSYAATSAAMEKAVPINVEKIEVKKLLGLAAGYGFEAFNFALGNGRFLYDGLRGIQSLYEKVDSQHFVPLAELDKLQNLPQEVKDAIRSATNKMGMSSNTLVGAHLSVAGSPASAHNRTLLIDPNLFPLYALDEQEAVIGHECSHIINKDTPFKRSLANLATPILSYALLKGYECAANRLLDNMKIKFSTGNDGVSKIIAVLKIFNNIIGFHFMPRYLLNLYLVSRCTQYQEARSDSESALKLRNPQGLINFFNKHQSPVVVKRSEEIAAEVAKEVVKQVNKIDQFMLFLRSKDGALGMPEHPSIQDRIKALELLKQKLNQ